MSTEHHSEEEIVEKLTVKIVSIEGALFDGDASFLVAPGKEGILGIAPQHTKLVSLLRAGEITVKKHDDTEEKFPLITGVLQVNRDSVEVLITA